MLKNINRNLVTILIFIMLTSLFGLILSMEYERAVDVQKEALRAHLDDLEEDVDTLFNERLFNLKGFIPHIQMNPDLSQEEFGAYSKLLLSDDDIVIKDITLAQDTTITHFYPVEGNEAIMGVDVAKLEGQTEKVLMAKNKGETVIDGPFPIVEGGMGIICRIPFDYFPEPGKSVYYGQLNYVVNLKVFLEQTGIEKALNEYNLRIDQVNQVDNSEIRIVTNYENFNNDAVTNTLQLPNALWKFTIEYKDGYNGLSVLFYLIAVLAVIVITLSLVSINTILKSKDALEVSLTELKKTQDKLVLSEKLAALGNLTANVAHEINTPLGNSISLTSFIMKKHEVLKERFDNGQITKGELESLFESSLDSYEMIDRNLNKMVTLVENFKLLTFDSQISELRYIDLNTFTLDLLNDLKINERLSISIECRIEPMRIFTDPVAIRNIISNLFKNSVVHGFSEHPDRKIYVHAMKLESSGEVVLEYWDNGIGFNETELENVFTPFFSTKKHKGHSGLGMHIVHNAVVNVLGGSIDIVKNPNGIDIITIKFKETQQR